MEVKREATAKPGTDAPAGGARIRRSLRTATIVAAIVFAFFLASEAAEALLADRTGSNLIGVAGAGVMALLLSPLQRMAERAAGGTQPGDRAVDGMARTEKRTLYREQASLAWFDGKLTAKERLLLDRLRQRLGLDRQEANRIERQALTQSSGRLAPHAAGPRSGTLTAP